MQIKKTKNLLGVEISVETAEINLLQWRKELRLKKERYFRMQVLAVLLVVTIILTLWHLVLWRQVDNRVKQTRYMQQQLLLLEQQLQNEDDTGKQQKQAQQSIDRIIKLEQQRVRLMQVFENLHRGITTGVQLTRLIIKKDDNKLFGKADSIFGITQLIKSLSQAKVQKISRQDDEYNFALSLF